MICTDHNHWSLIEQCPTCAQTAEPPSTLSTLSMMSLAEMVVPRWTPAQSALPSSLPPTLLLDPELRRKSWLNRPLTTTLTQTLDNLKNWTDSDLLLALEDSSVACVDRQPVYRELQRRQDRKKSLARIAAMKAKREVSCAST